VIRVFLLDRYSETIDIYLQSWGRPLSEEIRPVAYESLFPRGSIEGGVFIFSDLERLKDDEFQRADLLAKKVEAAGGRVLNKPNRVLRRYGLLRALYDSGRNPFNVYRLVDPLGRLRFPVFIRRERAHNGAMSPLLNNQEELDRTLAEMKVSQPITDDLLIVEYAHTADGDGLFRKYSVMRIDQTLIARHILFSRDWIDKDADVVTDEAVVEENQFLADFPHAQQVREIFDISGIDYGRIDYSVLDGKVVTWEINTNPRILPGVGRCDPRRMQGQAVCARQIRDAFGELTKAKSVTVPLVGCQRVVRDTGMSIARRMIYLGSWFWKEIGCSKVGRRVAAGISASINLGLNQNT
jgi:hypothetical protein